jgi:hypothetical protein
MSAKRILDNLEKTIVKQNRVIDELVKENYELKQMLLNYKTVDDKSCQEIQQFIIR